MQSSNLSMLVFHHCDAPAWRQVSVPNEDGSRSQYSSKCAVYSLRLPWAHVLEPGLACMYGAEGLAGE